MKQEVEKRLKKHIQKLIESIVSEEGPMEKPDDFKSKPVKAYRTPIIGGVKVDVGDMVGLIDMSNSSRKSLFFKKEDAIKLANYLIRVLGKV